MTGFSKVSAISISSSSGNFLFRNHPLRYKGLFLFYDGHVGGEAMNKREILHHVEREFRNAVLAQNPFTYSAYLIPQNIEDLWKEDYAYKKDL